MILKAILENTGFDPQRIWLRWISASEGKAFANIITEMVQELKKIGPNPCKVMWDI
jgi:F420-non-reducing hydrogenase iron-sulfur subunit